MRINNQQVWDAHYTRRRARQFYPDENVVRILKKEYPTANPKSVALDLGSGSGRHLPLLQEHFGRVIACDFSLNSLQPYSGSGITPLQAALPLLPFTPSAFDFILCWGVLHYLPDEALNSAIREIHSCLKPGGKVFLTLRSDKDTHLKAQLISGDLNEGHAHLFSKAAALSLFSNFSKVVYGFILRQPLGEENLVAHHMIAAQK